MRLALELIAAELTVGTLEGGALEAFETRLEATATAISDEQRDAANASFHEYQIDLAGSAPLERVGRALGTCCCR